MSDSPPRRQQDPGAPCYYHQDVRDAICAIQQRIEKLEAERAEDMRRLEGKINILIIIMAISAFISGGSLIRDFMAAMLRAL